LALSGTQIEAFGKFFNNYMDPALQLLNNQSVSSGKFSDGLSQNIDRSLKDHFCVQALGLTSVPDRIKKECESASIKMSGVELHFSDYLNKPHQERVCAYRNFLNKIDAKNSQRDAELGSASK
jgi:hypothetical protein